MAPPASRRVGITNQRETTVVWDRATGEPVAPAIVWQSRITAERCAALREAGHEDRVRALTGLPLDAYFSGPKIAHILDAEPGLRQRAEAGELCFGTVDSFLVWRLTGGRDHITDVSNASRTLLFDIASGAGTHGCASSSACPWRCCRRSGPRRPCWRRPTRACWACPCPSAASPATRWRPRSARPASTPGMAKNTYGTGAFALLNTGTRAGRLRRMACSRPSCGSSAKRARPSMPSRARSSWPVPRCSWLRDGLRAIDGQRDVERLAAAGDRDVGRGRRARLRRARGAALGPRCSRRHHGPDLRHRHRGHRPGHRRCHGLPGGRRARVDGARCRPARSAPCASTVGRR